MWDEDEVKEQAYNQLIERVKAEAANKEHNSAELRRLASEFRKFFDGYKDSTAIANECERVARNQELKDIYKALTDRMRGAATEQEFKTLAEEFTAMGAYPNASVLAAECVKLYNRFKEERIHMETKTEEQYYYTQYAASSGEMQRLSQKKVFKPADFYRLGDEWKSLSEQFRSIDRYRDASALADECAQKGIVLYEKAELAKKVWLISKIAVGAILLIVVVFLVISLINYISGARDDAGQPPEDVQETEAPTPEPQKQWNDAYGEYLLATNHTFTAEGDTASSTWGTSNIRFAELIDFDNNSTPELVVIVDIPALRPENSGHSRYWFLIFSYTDQMVPLYNEYITSHGSGGEDYAIATSADGKDYLVSRVFDSNGSITKEYFTLNGGQWTPSLTLEFIPGSVTSQYGGQDEDDDELYVDDDFDTEVTVAVPEDGFIINGEKASEAEFKAAETALLGIVRTRVLSAQTENSVQAMAAKLADTYSFGNIPGNSSLREPIHENLKNVIMYENGAVTLTMHWKSDSTTFIRAADGSEWSIITRTGDTGEVLPTFETEGEVLTIAFPTTDRLYYLSKDFTGRFSRPDGTNSESLTWTFIVG